MAPAQKRDGHRVAFACKALSERPGVGST